MSDYTLNKDKLSFVGGVTKQLNDKTVTNIVYEQVAFSKNDIILATVGNNYPSQYSYGNRSTSMTPTGTVYALFEMKLPPEREVIRTITIKRTSTNNYEVVVVVIENSAVGQRGMTNKAFSTIGKVNKYLLSLNQQKIPDELLEINTVEAESDANDEDEDCDDEEYDEDEKGGVVQL